MDPRVDRALTYSGVAGAVVAFGGIFLSAALTPGFSWTGNALSDLGRPGEPYAAVFNWGLILAGLLGSAFAVRAALAAGGLRRAGTVVVFGGTVSLTAIGLFPLDASPLHGPVSVAFFVLLTCGLWVEGAGGVRVGDRRLGWATVGLGTVNLGGWLAYSAIDGAVAADLGVAIPELVGAVALAAWVVPTTRRIDDRA